MGTKLNIVEVNLEDYRDFYESTPAASHSLFNSPDFLSYRDPNPLIFLDWRKQNTSFAQSACWVKLSQRGETSIVIPGGASFGGPVAQRRLRAADYVDILGALTDFAYSYGHESIEWTPHMPHHGVVLDEEAEFAALQLGFRVQIVGLESVALLPVTHDSKFRNLLRKCHREGIEYVDNIELDDFYTTLEEVYSRHETCPTHGKEELAILKARFPREIRFVGALKGGEIAATACLFRISPASDLVFYMCTVEKHKRDNPMMLLISEDMNKAKQAGCAFYNFGTSSIGLDIRDNVLNFKQQFNAQGFMRRKLVWHSARKHKMKRSIEDVRDYFDAKNDSNDFAALDYIVDNRPLTSEEYDMLIWSSVEQDMEFGTGLDILEIGSGVGLGLKKLESRSNRLIGTDISANLLNRYQGKAEILPIAAHEINFPPETLDRIFMVSVSILFPDAEYFKTVVKKAILQLKMGGILGIFDQYLHTKEPHPRYLSLDRCELSHFLDEIKLPYSIKAQNSEKRMMSNRYNLIIYKDARK